MSRSALACALLALACALLALVCSSARADSPPSQKEQGAITIFGASSLQEAFRALAARFTERRGVPVRLSFAGSQELRTQLEEGAQADLFASADRRHAEALERAQLAAGAPKVFATNTLVIAVAKGNPEQVRALADLARLKHLVVGAHEVPVGAYTEKLFALADAREPGLRKRLEARIASRELNVRQVLAKVALGEAEAGIVYKTDAMAMAAQVDAVALPPELQQPTEAVIVQLARAAHPGEARAFVELLLSREGQDMLRAQGFGPAGAP